MSPLRMANTDATRAPESASPSPAVPLAQVFGNSRGLPLTYVERPGIDATFLNHLAQGKHLIVYGASSQGKSSLVRRHIDATQYIEVQCAPSMQRYDVYRLLLREAGVFVSLGRRKRRTKGISAEVTLYREDTGTESETSEQTVNIDLANINDILNVLVDNNVANIIVLEDFHLLREQVQRQVAADLKTVYERSGFQVIVAGVWREADKLSSLSGYLPGRSTLFNVDRWSPRELEAVITAGGNLLNANFAPALTARIVELSSGNVGVLQLLCYGVCQQAGVTHTREESVTVTSVGFADAALQQVVEATAGRYRLFIERYSRRRSSDPMHLTKWIMHGILSQGVAALDSGVAAESILHHIDTKHSGTDLTVDEAEIVDADDGPSRYNVTTRVRPFRGQVDRDDVLKLLARIERYQRGKDINPMILSYDKRSERLRAVDIGFLLFLKSTGKAELLDRLPVYDDELDDEQLARALRGELDTTKTVEEAEYRQSSPLRRRRPRRLR